jgi:SAM-dependent methyltransferase
MKNWDEYFRKGRFSLKEPNPAIVGLVPVLKRAHVRRILDLGCGAGRHMVYLAKKDFFVVGSDSSPVALDIAEKRLRREGVDNCCLVENDMERFPFPDGHFDAVISTNVIHHNRLAGIRKTVGEIRRTLRRGGLVFVTVLSTKDYKIGPDIVGKKLEPNTWITVRGNDAGIAHHFFDERGIRSLFSKFKVVRMREVAWVDKGRPHSHWHVLARKRE